MTILGSSYCGKDRTKRTSKEPVICKKKSGRKKAAEAARKIFQINCTTHTGV